MRLPALSIELGRVLVDRADAFIAAHRGSQDALRRIFTLKLATVREDGEPTRRRAFRSEFSDEEWRVVGELADHPNRLLATSSTETGQTYAEVAHEAIFRRWDKLREWIDGEREFLIWRTGLERAPQPLAGDTGRIEAGRAAHGRRAHPGAKLVCKRAEDLPVPDREFIARSIERDNKAQARARRVRAMIYGLEDRCHRRPRRLDRAVDHRGRMAFRDRYVAV